jgi:hypothetical protein
VVLYTHACTLTHLHAHTHREMMNAWKEQWWLTHICVFFFLKREATLNVFIVMPSIWWGKAITLRTYRTISAVGEWNLQTVNHYHTLSLYQSLSGQTVKSVRPWDEWAHLLRRPSYFTDAVIIESKHRHLWLTHTRTHPHTHTSQYLSLELCELFPFISL